MKAWEDDRKSCANPYAETIIRESWPGPFQNGIVIQYTGSTMAEVRLQLAQEEARDGVFDGEDDETMCINSFLYRGLELEEQQYVYHSYGFTMIELIFCH